MSSLYEIGDAVALSWLVQVAGVATDATVVLTVTLPDGTSTTPTVSHVSTGNYAATLTAAQNGVHAYRWAATGAVTAAESGSFRVGTPVDLDEFKAAINKRTTDTSNDVELWRFVEGAVDLLENLCGPIVPRTITEVHDNTSGGVIVLNEAPVLSVISVTEYQGGSAQAYTAAADPSAGGSYTYLLNKASGLITRISSGGVTVPWYGPVWVTYIPGYNPVPRALQDAILLQAAHMYERTQIGGGGGIPNPALGGGVGPEMATYGLPNVVRDLIRGYLRVGGIG